jgi:hypothetical protein
MLDLDRDIDSVEHHVRYAEQVRYRLLLDPMDRALEQVLIFDCIHGLQDIVDSTGKETTHTSGMAQDWRREG